ncbi:MAG: tRNA (N6-threonylcarbamoyladenosine(37)-N6)-methyltransferase TrmO [Clostridia bacterium]|nr:tRNA (N6-threonylcarbamoyladenosine(37)-N6)-methyltransferase TrmO [Clostridia bacterium]
MTDVTMKPIATAYTDFPEKFGVPRQSGVVGSLTAKIVLSAAFRNPDALRGIEGFSHLWLIWDFSLSHTKTFSPTVRPPRLGGNVRMGVFATRSPFRPNPLGLSSVRLLEVDYEDAEGPVLYVAGADLVDGTPIFDIKPYLPYTDSHPDAVGGFAEEVMGERVKVEFPEELLAQIPPDKREGLCRLLAEDPRPGYQEDEGRVYGFFFSAFEIKFSVKAGVLEVLEVAKR